MTAWERIPLDVFDTTLKLSLTGGLPPVCKGVWALTLQRCPARHWVVESWRAQMTFSPLATTSSSRV